MKISPNKKFYISIAGLIVTFVILIVLVVFPIIQAIEEDAKKICDKKKAQAILYEERETLIKFQNIYIEISPDLERIEEMLVDSEVPIEFIDFLEKTAQESNVFIEISSVSQQREKDVPRLYSVFQLEALGSFSNFMVFLKRLENAIYLIEINGLTINRMGEESSKGIIEFSPDDISAKISLKVLAK